MKNYKVAELIKDMILKNETFLIISSETLKDKNNKEYMKIKLGDKSGKIDAYLWSDKLVNVDQSILKSGVMVDISGKIGAFKDSLQVVIEEIQRSNETKMEEYIESSVYSPDEMMEELLRFINEIKDRKIKEIVKNIISDKDIERRLKYWPAASAVHHNFRSGLLQHVIEMLNISNSLRRFFPNVNFDVLIAGIILHDIGKVRELDGYDLSVPYSKEGSLLGHITISLQIFDQFGGKNLPENLYLHIAHLILSHHGKQEYGSPIVPATVEAIMLSNIDELSAKSRTADSARKKIPRNMEFGERNMWLENAKMWRGDGYYDEENNSDNLEQLSF